MGISMPPTIRQRWEALNNGESFFVPSLDPHTAKKNLVLEGYVPRKNAPEARVGIFRGMSGVLCYRPLVSRREKRKTEMQDWS
jgi:hypothetical protein